MPFAVVLRLLLRVAASLLFWRFATARRGGHHEAARPGGRAAAPSHGRGRRRLTGVRENASIAVRVLALIALLAVAVLGTAAGLGPAILGPRWLGIALLVLAAGALGFAVLEIMSVQRA